MWDFPQELDFRNDLKHVELRNSQSSFAIDLIDSLLLRMWKFAGKIYGHTTGFSPPECLRLQFSKYDILFSFDSS